MNAVALPDLTYGPEWAVLELLCLPPTAPGRAAGLRTLLADPAALHWGELLEQAIRHKMLPLVAGHAASLAPGEAPWPRRIVAHLRSHLRLSLHRTRLYRAEAVRVTAALADARVPVAVTGGLAVEATLYDGTGARSFTDLDLLVPAGYDDAAAAVLIGIGYEEVRPRTFRRPLDDPVVAATIVDVSARLPVAGLDDRGEVVGSLLRGRTRQAVPGIAGGHLPVLADADRERWLSLVLHAKAHARAGYRGLALAACADVVRAGTATPGYRPDEPSPESPWWPARASLAWVATCLAGLGAGTTPLVPGGGDPARPGGSWATVRAHLHAKEPAEPDRHTGRPA